MSNTLKDIIRKPQLVFLTLGHREWFNWMSDELYLKIAFRIRMGKWPNLINPQTYSEKLQWIKLHDRNPFYSKLVDKYEVKDIVATKIGSEYIIPTIAVWNNVEEIDFDRLPNQFVLKCTHDSGGLVICKDKKSIDKNVIKNNLSKCLNHSYYWGMREWPYKDLKPRIIAEKYMEDETGELRDFKFFCFNGEVKAMFIATERSKKEETKFDFFDENYNHLPFTNGHPNANVPPQKPKKFEEMKKLAAILSKGIPQVRVDFYEISGKVFFGEMTFFHWSGMTPFNPEEWDNIFGSWIKLPAQTK